MDGVAAILVKQRRRNATAESRNLPSDGKFRKNQEAMEEEEEVSVCVCVCVCECVSVCLCECVCVSV